MIDSKQVLLVAAERMETVREAWGAEARVDSVVVVYYMVGDDGMSVLESIDSGMARWQASSILKEASRRIDIDGDKERDS